MWCTLSAWHVLIEWSTSRSPCGQGTSLAAPVVAVTSLYIGLIAPDPTMAHDSWPVLRTRGSDNAMGFGGSDPMKGQSHDEPAF